MKNHSRKFFTQHSFLPVLTFVALLFFSNASSGQAPDLGAASRFSLFTAVGAFTSVGTTHVTGNIGTNAGILTGFPPGTLVGEIHIADSLSTQAAISMDAVYSYLTGITCGTVLGTALGNNQVLTPKVYCLGAASTLNGDLILDAQGDPNALFIFKIDGAFATGISSNVILINSASINNVYWQINGQTDIGDNSVFRGIIVGNGAMNLLAGSSLEGRGLLRAGAISLFNNTVVPLEIVPLPLTLVSFSATRQGNNALLEWETATEQNNRDFTVERNNSEQAMPWKTIGKITAAGNSTSARQYKMVDDNVNKGTNYYRLRSTGIDGTSTVSNVRGVYFSEASFMPVSIFPNPMTNSFTMTGAVQESAISLADITGKTMDITFSGVNGVYQAETSNLTVGTYFLKTVAPDGSTTITKLNKQ